MARRGVKKRDFEKLDDLTVSRVVSLLEQSSPITKKAACEILHISYNTKRLGNIIEEYKDRIAYANRRRKQNRGKEFSDMETQDLVISYLSGEGITSISGRLFRSIYTIKDKIEKLNLPIRDKTADYRHPKMMPDEMVSETFEVGEYVWSTRYNCVAEIIDQACDICHIYIFGKYMQFGYQPVYELGKLESLKGFTLRGDEFKTNQDFNMRIT